MIKWFRTPRTLGVLRVAAGIKADARVGEGPVSIPMRAKQTSLPTEWDDLPITNKTFFKTFSKYYYGNCETKLKIKYMRNRRLARRTMKIFEEST